MNSLSYGRQIRLTVAERVFEDLRIAFRLERSIDHTQLHGSVTVFNIADKSAFTIRDRGNAARLEAGYKQGSGLAILFDGRVQRVSIRRDGLSFKTTIKLGDEVRAVKRLGGTFMVAYDGPRTVRDIVREIAAVLKLPLGPLDNIPPGATYTDFYWGGGTAASALDLVLRRVDCSWFEADGVIRINKVGLTQSDQRRLVLTPDTGLIGTLTVLNRAEGASVRTFLDPRVQLGCTLAYPVYTHTH